MTARRAFNWAAVAVTALISIHNNADPTNLLMVLLCGANVFLALLP
jgi:hypothetical protein